MAKQTNEELENGAIVTIETPVETPETPELASPVPPSTTMSVGVGDFTQILAMMNRMMNDNREAMAQMIQDLRKPPIDPIKEAQHKHALETKLQSEKNYWEGRRRRSLQCTHLREDMTSAIAWAAQSDTYANYPDLCEKMGISGSQAVANIVRGACQHCDTCFSPIRKECVSDEVHTAYLSMRRIPTQRGSAVLHVNS